MRCSKKIKQKTEGKKKYLVTLTEEHARVVQKAVEMYFRLMMGQDWDFSDEITSLNTDLSPENPHHDEIFNRWIQRRDHVREIMQAVFRIAFEPTGHLDRQSDDMMIAQCIWDTLRFARGQGRWDSPFHIGPEPVPDIKVIEERRKNEPGTTKEAEAPAGKEGSDVQLQS